MAKITVTEQEFKLLPLTLTDADLANRSGGQWKFNRRSGAWECDDSKRTVVGTFDCDCDPDFCPHPVRYYLYGDGSPKFVG